MPTERGATYKPVAPFGIFKGRTRPENGLQTISVGQPGPSAKGKPKGHPKKVAFPFSGGRTMVGNVIEMAGWRRTHRNAALFPVIAYNAWVDYCNTVARAWVDAFNPYR